MATDPRILAAVEAAMKDGRIISSVGVNESALEGKRAVFIPPPEWDVSEKEFQSLVNSQFDGQGWMVYHTHDSRRSQSGFPDTTCVGPRIIYIELKVPPNKPSKTQLEWGRAIEKAGGEWYCLYPHDWDKIVTLSKGGRI